MQCADRFAVNIIDGQRHAVEFGALHFHLNLTARRVRENAQFDIGEGKIIRAADNRPGDFDFFNVRIRAAFRIEKRETDFISARFGKGVRRVGIFTVRRAVAEVPQEAVCIGGIGNKSNFPANRQVRFICRRRKLRDQVRAALDDLDGYGYAPASLGYFNFPIVQTVIFRHTVGKNIGQRTLYANDIFYQIRIRAAAFDLR